MLAKTRKVGIAVSSKSSGFGVKGFYHSQEIGLACKFAENGYDVAVFKALPRGSEPYAYTTAQGVTVNGVEVPGYGIQGLLDPAIFPTDLDALVYFSDTQIALNRIYRWARKQGVAFFPYVGITASKSGNLVVEALMNLHYRLRTLPIYRKHGAIAKTPAVRADLLAQGVTDVKVAPVGIDYDLLHAGDSDSAECAAVCASLGVPDDSTLLLYVGRLQEHKSPANAIDLLAALPSTHHLLMIGKGELYDTLVEQAQRLGVETRVHWLESVPNAEMYRYYQAADVFVNVNHEEIFGMAVVEAVYYKCRTLALTAPGPDFILEGMQAHRLCSSMDEMTACLQQSEQPQSEQLERDKQQLMERCNWQVMVDLVEEGLVKRSSCS